MINKLSIVVFSFIAINLYSQDKEFELNHLKTKLENQEKELSDIQLKYDKTKAELVRLKDSLQPPKYWKIDGSHSLMFNQSAFKDWYTGGDNVVAFVARIDYNFKYRNGKHSWLNRILLNYGQRNQSGTVSKKTEDNIDLSTRYGYEFTKAWLLSFNLEFNTQFANGYDYDKSDVIPISKFLAPAFLTFGPGIDYRPSDNFWVSVSPASSKVIFVSDSTLSMNGAFGVKPGETVNYELGGLISSNLSMKLMKNVSMINRLALFSNYLDYPGHIDIKFNTVINLKINDYLSSQVTLDLLYDHDIILKTQLKETLGIGITYRFER